MKSNPRFWLLLGAVGAFLLGLVGWLFVISPHFAAAAQTRTEAQQINSDAERVMMQVRQLKEQEKDLPAQLAALRAIQDKIPTNVDVPRLLREIERAAKANDVTLTEVAPGTITPFVVGAETSTSSSSSSTAEGTASAAPKPQPTESAVPGQGAVPEGAALSYVPVTISASGDYPGLQGFTVDLEQLDRALLVTSSQVARTEGADGDPLTAKLECRVFVVGDKLAAIEDLAQGVNDNG